MSEFDTLETIIRQGLEDVAPAIALAVYYQDELLLDRAYGYLDPETRQQPINHFTLFDLASLTKMYTVTAFLRLVARAAIALDDPVQSIIPEFGRYGLRPIEGGQDPHTLERLLVEGDSGGMADPATITFRHLLTHTGGLAPWRDLFLNVGPVPPPPGEADPVSRQERVARALDLIARYPFVDMPGQAMHYSDLGLILLGEAVARLHGVESLQEVVADLSRPVTYRPREAEKCPPTEFDGRWRGRRCQGEVHDENAAALGGIAGHAGLFGNAHAVATFGWTWLRATQDRAETWLSHDLAREAVQAQVTRGTQRRRLGWLLKVTAGSSAGDLFNADSFGHTGFTGTSLWIDPQRELVVALLTNRVYFGRDVEGIVNFRPAVHDTICRWVDAL